MPSLQERFEACNAEYHKFDDIAGALKPFACPDLCAFAKLQTLAPEEAGTELISSAEHDVIYLNTDPEQLNEAASDNDILYLVRCGVRYDEDYDCLAMFV